MNFADVLDIGADRAPSHEAITLNDRSLTHEQLRTRAGHVAGMLRDAGIGQGDKVGVLLHNAFEFAEIAYGLVGIGAVLVPLNPRLAGPEITYILDHAEASAAFFGGEFASVVAEILPSLPNIRVTYRVDANTQASSLDDGQHVIGQRYDEILAASPCLTDWKPVDPAADCMIVYSSGTTGRPKGAVRSHQSAAWGASNFTAAHGDCSLERDRFLYPIPLASIGFLNVFSSCLFAGLPVELMYRFDPGAALRLIQERSVTHAYLVPAMWRSMLHAAEAQSNDVRSLRVGIWGGEPMDDQLRSSIVERFGHILVGVYGSTEAALLSARPGDDRVHPRTVGRPAGYNIFRIVDEQGYVVPRGNVGELITRGPAVMSGYYKNDEATAEVMQGSWYHTGDLGIMDADGFTYVVDRKREMLISGGQNVYPVEIERVLCDHQGVVAAAIVGAPDDNWGEVPMAFVIANASHPPTSAEMANHVRGRLAKYKVPKYWQFVEELPTNANGKVQKNALREQARTQELIV